MYTYLRPKEDELPTRASVARRGNLQLYHALDVKRLVAFVGSGVSAAYGRPSWGDLARILLRVTAETAETQAREAPASTFNARTVRDLLREVCSILELDAASTVPEIGRRPDLTDHERKLRADVVTFAQALRSASALKAGSVTSLLELCERIVGAAGDADALRRNVEWMFGRHRQVQARLYAAGLDLKGAPTQDEDLDKDAAERNFAFLEAIYTDDAPNTDEYDQYKDNIIKRLRNPAFEKFAYLGVARNIVSAEANTIVRALSNANDAVNDLPDLGRTKVEDPLYELRETLGIRRFLTINYDSEIETFLNERLGYISDTRSDGDGARRYRDGFGGIAEIGNATQDELGQLVAFAAVSNPLGVRVLHLHGQSRRPESLVLTEKDYQTRYLGSMHRRRAFHEALEALFTGNSVLFVGIGMNEADLLRSFRQFASVSRDAGTMREPRYGQAMALLPDEGPSKSSARALELEQTYGVSARFFGGSLLQPMRDFITAVRDLVRASMAPQTSTATEREAAEAAFCALDRALADVEQSQDRPPADHGDDQAEDRTTQRLQQGLELLAGGELSGERGNLLRIEAKVLAALYGVRNGEEFSPSEDAASRYEISLKLMEIYFERLEADVLTLALCTELRVIAAERHTWAQEWVKTPETRRAVFHNVTGSATNPVWSRHHIRFEPRPDGQSEREDNPVYEALKRLAQEVAVAQPSGHRRILRAAIPRGGGKGSVLRAIIGDLEFHADGGGSVPKCDVFPALSGSAPQQYEGAFVSHSNFLTEYGTVSAALYRFLRIAMLTGHERANLPLAAAEYEAAKPMLEPLHWHERDVLKPGAPPRKVSYETRARGGSGARASLEYREEGDTPLLGGIDRIPLLRAALFQLCRLNQQDNEKRWLIVLTGIDRLCDAGDPVSRTIRIFFETLTDPRFVAAPLDIILLSGDTDHGIVGLSEEDETEPYRTSDPEVAPGEAPEPADGERAKAGPRTRRPWPRITATDDDDRFKGRPWRKVGETTALPDYRHISRLPGDYPALEAAMADNRVLDCWVWLLITEILDPRRTEAQRDHKARPTNDRAPRLLEAMNAAARGGHHYRVVDTILAIRGRIERFDEYSAKRWAALKEATLKHLSLMTIPVERDVLLDIPEISDYLDASLRERSRSEHDQGDWIRKRNRAWGAEADDTNWSSVRLRREAMTQCLRELIDAGLVLPVQPQRPILEDPNGDLRYGVHSFLRQCITRKMNLPLRDVAQRNLYDVSVHEVMPRDLPTPGHSEFREITHLVQHLVDKTLDDLKPWIDWLARAGDPKPDEDIFREMKARFAEFDEERFVANSRRLRACFSILQGVLSIGAIARLDRAEPGEIISGSAPFETYRSVIRALINASTTLGHLRALTTRDARGGVIRRKAYTLSLADETGPTIDNAKIKSVIDTIIAMREPLYVSESVWLYNERALISYLQGRMFDAHALYDLSRTVATARAVSTPLRDNPTIRRIHLSRALVLLEMGKIVDCRNELQSLVREVSRKGDEPSITHELAKGYLGVCAHLEGRFDTAAAYYEDAIAFFEAHHNLRAVANFNRFYADLLRRDRKTVKAREKIERSRIAAARQEHRDLMHHALISHARLLRECDEPQEATRLLRKAEEYARAMGSHKIAADALRCLGHIMLAEGETEFAGRLAVEAMAITSISGMRLRKIANVILYGEVLKAREQPLYARPVLRQALFDAERCGYQLKASRAADLLHEVETQLNAATGIADRPSVKPLSADV